MRDCHRKSCFFDAAAQGAAAAEGQHRSVMPHFAAASFGDAPRDYSLTRLHIQTILFWSSSTGEPAHEDEDVRRERQRILAKPGNLVNVAGSDLTSVFNDDVLIVENLSKVFHLSKGMCRGSNRKVAVDRMYLGVGRGECFGLLGVNGAGRSFQLAYMLFMKCVLLRAGIHPTFSSWCLLRPIGKTTTFRMLTGDETMTNGTAYLDGLNIRTDMPRVRQRIGYCPQFDGLIELMTGKELLTMYARLRGVPEPEIAGLVTELAESLMLEKHIEKPCGTYSGGNKRKLSTAVALCGPSPVVYLDEPTTGVLGGPFFFPLFFFLPSSPVWGNLSA
jgi:ATP-binding cassette subfamily A (ABC1) protein 3